LISPKPNTDHADVRRHSGDGDRIGGDVEFVALNDLDHDSVVGCVGLDLAQADPAFDAAVVDELRRRSGRGIPVRED
jgi:hypothetical protein